MLPGKVDERPYDSLDFDDVRELLGIIEDTEKRYLLLQRLSDAPESGYRTVDYSTRKANYTINPFMNYRVSDLKQRLTHETDIPKKRLIQEALRMQGVQL